MHHRPYRHQFKAEVIPAEMMNQNLIYEQKIGKASIAEGISLKLVQIVPKATVKIGATLIASGRPHQI